MQKDKVSRCITENDVQVLRVPIEQEFLFSEFGDVSANADQHGCLPGVVLQGNFCRQDGPGLVVDKNGLLLVEDRLSGSKYLLVIFHQRASLFTKIINGG